MKKIDFIYADGGKVCLGSGSEMVVACDNSEDLAAAIRILNLDLSGAFASSSMDFASEYGFTTNDGAYDILFNAVEIA